MSFLWRNQWASSAVVLFVWLALRIVFFEGYWGYDDIPHVAYAANPRVPEDVFEARLLYNVLLMLSYAVLDVSEISSAVPTLAASLCIVATVWWTGRRQFGPGYGLAGGLLASMVSLDITQSTVPMATPIAAALAGAATIRVLFAKRKQHWVLGGVLFGLAINTHLATAFYFGPVLVVMFAARPARRQLVNCCLMLAAVILSFAVAEAVLAMTFSGGNIARRLEIIEETHLSTQVKAISPTLEDGSINPQWFTWPAMNFFFSRELGLIFGLAVCGGFWFRRRFEWSERVLLSIVVSGWLYIVFGTQQLSQYAPLDHQMRYWYPLLAPTCLLAAAVLRQLHQRRRASIALLILLFAPLPVLPVLSGSWGQNVEVSRVLLAHAKANPDRVFATDIHTLEEMLVLNDMEPPPNVLQFDDAVCACNFTPTVMQPGDKVDGYLVNVSHFERPKARRFAKFAMGLETQELSKPQRHPLASWLPAFITGDKPWVRRYAASVGVKQPPHTDQMTVTEPNRDPENTSNPNADRTKVMGSAVLGAKLHRPTNSP